MCGWMNLTGEPDGPPTKSGLSLVDFSSGYVLSAATIAGIHAARRDGVGMDCHLSPYDAAMNLLSYPGTLALTEDYIGTGWGQGRYAGRYFGSLVADEARDLYAFYRFHPDDSGEIVAEQRRADLDDWVGRRYPAGDIPAQARRL